MNLIELTKKKVLEECVEAVKPASGWKVMVVDHDAMKVISAGAAGGADAHRTAPRTHAARTVCKMYDIVEQGVTVVEKLELARQPMPRMEVRCAAHCPARAGAALARPAPARHRAATGCQQ